jgi:F-type H+-transporting ATPase subunit b
MEFINKIGLETKLLFFQIINFLIVMYVLKKFLYIPIKKIIDERKYKIKQSLLDIENAKIILQTANDDKKKILFDAKNISDNMISSVKLSIDNDKKNAIVETKKISEQMLIDAEHKIEEEFISMHKNIETISIDLANKIILKTLPNLFTDNEKKIFLSDMLKKANEKISN